MSVRQPGRATRSATSSAPEVYSADEVARAARVDRRLIRRLIAAGEIGTVDGALVAGPEAARAVRRLRRGPVPAVRPLFGGALLERSPGDPPSAAVSAAISTLAHGALVPLVVMLTAVRMTTAAEPPPAADTTPLSRLVFVAEPGPGGGGGGGGLRQPLPPPRAERRGESRASSPVPPREEPAVVEPAATRRPEPLESEALPRIAAPLLALRADRRDLRGLLESPPARGAPSQGPGRDGGVGAGAGRGVGSGAGAGVGPGAGGGAGGGPYRPGSGISPPAIQREVKPVYTAEALRREVEGDVVLEVVVLASGAVGEIRVVRGLGHGLDEAAVTAMRGWRFHPARRQGAAVDVVVEVAMEFRLR